MGLFQESLPLWLSIAESFRESLSQCRNLTGLFLDQHRREFFERVLGQCWNLAPKGANLTGFVS